MPYCPKCRLEYVEGATECPDCGVELAAGSAAVPAQVPEPPEVAYTGNSEMEVLRAEAFLASEGIVGVVRKFGPEYYILDDAVKDPSGAWGQVLVPPSSLARAKELLASLEPVPPEELEEAVEDGESAG